MRYSPSLTALGESAELGAIPEEVGPHGEHDVDWAVSLFAGFEEKGDEVPGLFLRETAHATEAKDFLKLVDDEEEVGALRKVALFNCFHESLAASAKGGAQVGCDMFLFAVVDVGIDEGFGEVCERVTAWAHDGNLP